ncbi:TatD family hydrolase [Adlercreutzia sp. R7]|uniref:TatD family hydrolase n=1 Tax=Adlercreutzia wanghongyangiae TaxID=3111451 RepID=A0ABU6IK82_9ACTN|nr:TatD family hydrolase [Adlercreutzia sp. R7]
METWYDMHCHLGFAPDPTVTAAAAEGAGVRAFSCTAEPAEYERLQAALADARNVAVGLGAHPWWIADGRVGDTELERFCALAPATRYIGEIGLDFAGPRDTEESRARQTDAFAQLLAACDQPAAAPSPVHTEGRAAGDGHDGTRAAVASDDQNRPGSSTLTPDIPAMPPKLISIHAVNAAGVALDLLEQAGTLSRHQVILHWFSGTSDDLIRAVRAGCFFSVGPRMLASRRGREYVRQIPLDRLLLETDMPSRAGDTLAAEVWHAELGNALAGIAQLKQLPRKEALAAVNQTSARLLAV